jgi:anti-anti-sigma regulatory factor
MPLYIVEKLIGGIIVLGVRGRITLGRESETFRHKIRQLIDAGYKRLILDLREITYIDSMQESVGSEGCGTYTAGRLKADRPAG